MRLASSSAALAGLLLAGTAVRAADPSSLLLAPPPPTSMATPTSSATDVLTAPATPTGPRAWVSAEYLIWFTEAMQSPQLVRGVAGSVAAQNPTGVNVPANAVADLFPGNFRIRFPGQNGYRISGGAYLDPAGEFGIDASVFQLESAATGFGGGSNGFPVALARPYVNAATGQDTTLYTSLPGQYSGTASAFSDTQFYGADINARARWYAVFASRNDLQAGFKYLDLSESVQVRSSSQFTNGTAIQTADTVRTDNHFYGGQVGLQSRFGGCDEGLAFDGGLKLGLGGVHERAQLFGSNTVAVPGQPVSAQPVGLYTQATNAGTFNRDRAEFSLDLSSNLSYYFRPGARVFVGYSIIYLSSVLRPSDQINPVVNDSRARFVAQPTPSNINAPTLQLVARDFWVQGINLGLSVAY